MKKTKYDYYVEVYEEFILQLSTLEIPGLELFINAFKNMIVQLTQWEDTDSFPLKKSEIAVGMEQGLNDLEAMFQELREPERSNAFVVYYSVLNKVMPSYIEQRAKTIDKVITQGSIKSNREYYLLRAKLDLVEGEGSALENTLYQLLERYEIKA